MIGGGSGDQQANANKDNPGTGKEGKETTSNGRSARQCVTE